VFEQLANIGELIGGFGALAALVYLAAQVRNSNRIARASSRQQLLDTFYDRAWETGTDPRLARILAGGVMDWEALSNQDKTTFHNMMARWLGNIENGLALHKDGLVEDEPVIFIARAMATCINAPGGRVWWSAANRGEFVSPKVATYLEGILADPEFEAVGFEQVFPFWAALADESPSAQ